MHPHIQPHMNHTKEYIPDWWFISHGLVAPPRDQHENVMEAL